jgi:hypothetical protein
VLQFLLNLHSAMAPIILTLGAASLITGLALLYSRRRSAATESATGSLATIFRILLAATAAGGVLQAIFGLLLVFQDCQPRENLHYVYGIIVLAAIPVAYVYSDQKEVRRDIIIMSIAAVAIIGAVIRGLATGPGGVCH